MGAIDLRNKIENKLKNLAELPTLPKVASKIINLSENHNASASHIKDIISLDQSLTAKILKVVNSSFYGFQGKISSVSHAVVILGFNEVKNLAIATSVFGLFSRGKSPDFYEKEYLWRHSAACAVVSKKLAERLGYEDGGDFFLAGLLHDIGILFLVVHTPEEMIEILKKSKDDKSRFVDVEEEIIGTNHAVVGGKLVDLWKLPSSIKSAVRYHHNPKASIECPHLPAIVSLASSLCNVQGMGWNLEGNHTMYEGTLDILKKDNESIDNDFIDSFLTDMEKELSGIDEFLELLH